MVVFSIFAIAPVTIHLDEYIYSKCLGRKLYYCISKSCAIVQAHNAFILGSTDVKTLVSPSHSHTQICHPFCNHPVPILASASRVHYLCPQALPTSLCLEELRTATMFPQRHYLLAGHFLSHDRKGIHQ